MSSKTITKTTSSSGTKSVEDQAARYQQLKLRKDALEKKLNEKYELLHQICQKEALLIGNNLDLISTSSAGSASQPATLRNKKLGSSFKLPESPNHDELNKLLLQRQMQQQISQASYRIANDPLQSKSIRRTHKLTYETSQQKISQINEHINLIQRQHSVRPLSQDDIDLHRNDNRFVKSALALVGNNVKNLQLLNGHNPTGERRNSMKSTTSSLGSSNTFIVQASPSSASSLTSLKILPNGNMSSPRSRNENINTRFDYDFYQKVESPTPSNFSLQSPPVVNHQLPLCSQSLKNIKINTDNHSISSQEHYNQFINQQSSFGNQFAHQPHISPVSRQMHANENKFIHRLHSFHQQYQQDQIQQKLLYEAREALQEDPRLRQVHRTQTMNNHHSPNHYTPAHSAGLGGYWTINESNQRIWVSDSKYPLSPPSTNMSKKSNSLGNFEFMHKNDNDHQDTVSISSGTSNEHKKKEKVWSETSIDDVPIVEAKQYKPRIESPSPTDVMNNNNLMYEAAHSPPLRNIRQQPKISQYKPRHHEGIYLNPLANTNNNSHQTPPNIPPKSTLRYTESIRSIMSSRDAENNVILSPQIQHAQIQVESPQNVTIIQEGSWKPYKEEIKSYEISDFYKYSQKYRQQQQQLQQHNNVDC